MSGPHARVGGRRGARPPGHRGGPGHRPTDRGGVTAELALVLPAVVLLLVVLLVAAAAAVSQVRVADAARAGARAAALGEPAAVITSVAEHLAGPAATVRVGRDQGYVVVTVTRELPGLLAVTDLTARATARAVPEPGEGP
ncbi:TadE family type IV pilus minor pilin [Georgenia sp. TF02-10]|uniref:TadE family type IV pilus minor pilin n=1 Tax=Georgenia sp. TF02-10 TaxID=2917725 RepID=UPI0027385759|nr:TadE family type IV pilus minor pilin [Georgenia sp. TF02-10]